MAKSHPRDRLLERFETIPDPRVNRRQRHVFTGVIVLTRMASRVTATTGWRWSGSRWLGWTGGGPS
jgi:hypothetical protein